jgi:SAM-dependent methyltransferase
MSPMTASEQSELFTRRDRAEAFGSVAEQYERARPGYPEELLDRLTGGNTPDVLDVGCGTGKVAAALAARGCRVLGVEIDARMAAVARSRGIEVEVARFEDWDDRGRRFELLACGQAWHWIDPERGGARAAEVLRPGGRLALFWNFGDPPQELAEAMQAVYRRLAAEIEFTPSGCAAESRTREAVACARLPGFEGVEIEHYPWRTRLSAAEWTAYLATTSDHLLLAPDRREQLLRTISELIQARGGFIAFTFRTLLVTALRR